ncbi:hypothetical protein QJQ45_002129 [Haematococcus lacustris]|nr:hypothetical protein QJQ45_002129 [Haematococcus lacustris]
MAPITAASSCCLPRWLSLSSPAAPGWFPSSSSWMRSTCKKTATPSTPTPPRSSQASRSTTGTQGASSSDLTTACQTGNTSGACQLTVCYASLEL